jgi:TonB family protein
MKRVVFTAALLFATSLHAQESAVPRVYELADVETRPVPTNLERLRAALESTYPAEKQAAGQGATVSVAFVLGADGTPRDLTVMQSTDAAFDSATLAAMALLRFTPATVGGQPVAVRVEVPVQWKPAAPAEAQTADFTGVGVTETEREPEIAPDGVRVYSLSEVDEMPRPTNLPALRRELKRVYPHELRDAAIRGLVQVSFVISEHGEVGTATVTSSNDPRFNEVTQQAIRVLRFRPGRLGGRAVRTRVELPIQWQVDREEEVRPPRIFEPDAPGDRSDR